MQSHQQRLFQVISQYRNLLCQADWYIDHFHFSRAAAEITKGSEHKKWSMPVQATVHPASTNTQSIPAHNEIK